MFDFIDKFRKGLSKIKIEIPEESIKKMEKYFNLLNQKRSRLNLIGPMDEERIVDYLFLDSLLILRYFPLIPGENVVDVGCGAGFPGLVLKAARPKIHIALLDSSMKKIEFLKTVCNELKLEEVEFITDRAEGIGKDAGYRERYDTVLSRAVADLSAILELCAPLTRVGGRVVIWKGKKYEEDIACLRKGYEKLGLSPPIISKPFIEGREWTTVLISYEKVEKTPSRFPRSYQAICRKSIGKLK